MYKGSGLAVCGGTERRTVELISVSREVRRTTCASSLHLWRGFREGVINIAALVVCMSELQLQVNPSAQHVLDLDNSQLPSLSAPLSIVTAPKTTAVLSVEHTFETSSVCQKHTHV
jgi:hypothetical protein